MKLTLIRETFLPDRTLGKLYINGVYFCDTLEDTDRELEASTPLEKINEIKIKHKTCIPTGTYKVVISFSPRFGTQLPLLLNVPGFLGIRIHSGNTPEHTSGCILLGRKRGDIIRESKATMLRFFSILKRAEKLAPVTIDIKY